MQEKISGLNTLFKLYVVTDEDLNILQSQLRAQQLPVDQRGGSSLLSAAEVFTILMGARGGG